MKVLVETSARHLHISKEHLAILFGEDAVLSNKKDLSQPGQFASNEKVEVIGPKGSLVMSILGPTRSKTQVELALTDARKIGVTAPIRESGDIADTGSCTLKGPKGEVEIKEGVIAAKRHIHFSTQDAKEFGITDKQIVSVKLEYNGRTTTFDDVVARVNPQYALAMHLDTDEANAAAIPMNAQGEVIL